jgi:hypothetical protein
MALVLKDRVLESSTSTGTGSFTLTGAQTGYQSFTAIGNGNTTYYTIQGKNPDGTLTGEWEVGLGTWSTGNTLSRDTVLSNSLGTTAKIVFSAGAKDVFCDYPASKSVNQNADNKVLIPYTPGITNVGSLNVGDATAHTDSGVIAAFTASEPLYLYTSLQNTSSANTSYASYAVNDGGHTSYGELGINNSNYSYSAAGYPNNTFSAPLATFVESYGGPLAIGTWDSQKISFIVNGSVNTADAMTISAAGIVSLGTALGVTSGGTGTTTSTGTGSVVLSTSPTLVTPVLGTPTSATLTNATGLPIVAGTTGTLSVARGGTGVTTSTGTGNVVLSASPTLTGTLSAAIITASANSTFNGVAVGKGAANISTNLAVGQDALASASTTGIGNVAVSYIGTMSGLTTGTYNMALGGNALSALTTGTENVAMGVSAVETITTGSFNTGVGAQALRTPYAGSNNVAIGKSAGSLRTGSNQLFDVSNGVYIGAMCLGKDNAETNVIVIGQGAQGLGSNTTVIGNSSTTQTRLWGNTVTGLVATPAAAPTIASATTIAPTTPIVFVSGVTPIVTITAPAPIASGGGQITIIPTGIFTTTTAGNIALASTSIVSRALIMTYDTTTAKWYPSY